MDNSTLEAKGLRLLNGPEFVRQRSKGYRSAPGLWSAAAFIVVLSVAIWIRVATANSRPLSVDEAESSINALTILEHGYPTDSYLGLPIYENTLVRKWPGNPEYEFKDISYSDRGVAVYHGWLPLYAIAGAFAAGGVKPDVRGSSLSTSRTPAENERRAFISRVPALVFGAALLVLAFFGARQMLGTEAAWIALTVTAFAETAIRVSQEARYYAPLFLFSTASCVLVWKIWSAGKWRHYIAAAFVFAFLFHTHLIGFATAAVMMLLTTLFVLRKRVSDIYKILVFGGIVAVATVPWLIGTGFLEHRSFVPPGWTLMQFPRDLFHVIAERLEFLALFVVYAMIVVCARLRKLPERCAVLTRSSEKQIAFLFSWAIIGHVMAVLLMPSASVFWDRMNFSYWGVIVFLFAGVTGVLVRMVVPRRTPVVAVLLTLVVLGLRGHFSGNPDYNGGWTDTHDIVKAIQSMRNAPNTKIYSNPNTNLAFMFYSGMPVQSIAPVRKYYLDSYPGTVAYIVPRQELRLAKEYRDSLERVAAAHGVRWPHERTICEADLARTSELRRKLEKRVAHVVPPVRPVPAFFAAAYEQLRQEHSGSGLAAGLDTPIVRGIDVRTTEDWWQVFVYRFSGHEQRWRDHANYVARLQNSTAWVIPSGGTTIYVSPGPASSPLVPAVATCADVAP